ncbi:hypothetical protein [Curtobacterium pusillum]|uniref:hypothetical protein n=1 Tax=Curtobacterium pusillum TaxID=69373 RepID=UPI0011A01C60|nr:hypothetical protein [Curtobacterium pusillum]
MRPPHALSWRQDSPDGWTGLVDGVSVATISYRRQYELETLDHRVHGSHSSLGSAQAQFAAWQSWDDAQDAPA